MSKDIDLPFQHYVSSLDNDRIRELRDQEISTDELWDMLGVSVEGDAATGEDPDGKGIFNRQILRIKKAICGNQKLMDFLDSPAGSDVTNLVIVLTGALVAAKFYGIDVVAIAFLISRIGVRELCASERIE